MSKVTLEELKQHCIKTIEACEQIKRIPNVRITDDRRSQEHKLVLQLIEEHEQRQSTDAVSREAVLDEFDKWVNSREKYYEHPVEFARSFMSLPLVTPERPKGEWVKYSIPRCGEQHYKCSHCDEYVNFGLYGDFYTKDFIYCPHCGADMRG